MSAGSFASLDGKVALVTGASRGIGKAIALELGRAGADVVLSYRTGREEAEAVASEVGGRAVEADVSDPASAKALVEEAGDLDILVNNAGLTRDGVLARMSDDDWRAVIETNLNGVFYCCHEAIPQMKRRGGGYIFNISSLAGKNPIVNGAAYNASKFGLNGFSEALMMEVRYDGIRVSYLMPGSVATEFGRGAREKMDWALQPADVAAVVIDLLRAPAHALYSRVEMRPSRPPRKG